jgi:hypothetical protein
MINARPRNSDLFAALIAAVEDIGGNRHEQISEGIRCQEENGEQPDISFIAETLGVSLDRLTTAMAIELEKRTGDVIVARGRVQ